MMTTIDNLFVSSPSIRTRGAAIGMLLCFVIWLMPTLAMAQTAVLDVEGKGLTKDTSKTLTSILRNEAQQTLSSQVVNKTPVNLSEFVILLGCDASSVACLAKVAKQLKAQRLLIGKLDKESNNKYRLFIEIYDTKKDKVTHRLQKVISGTDLNVNFRMEAEQFFKSVIKQAQAASLTIKSNVRGARVTLNGNVEGTTPFTRTGMKPGKYNIAVTSDGFNTWKLTLELAPKSKNNLTATLEKKAVEIVKTTPDPKKTTDPKANKTTVKTNVDNTKSDSTLGKRITPSDRLDSTNWGAWGLVTVGGVALIGSGVSAILMKDVEGELRERFNDNLSREEYDELNNRGQNYQTAHRILLGAGLASAAIGGLWLLFDGGDEQQAGQLRLYPTGSGVEARIQW